MDYMLYVEGAAAVAEEAKKEGWTLSGVEAQSKRYSEGLPDALPAYRRPLPFLYESTGVETLRRSRRLGGSGLVYVIECPSGERQFRRTTMSTALRAHKDSYGDRWYGRRGILVDAL
ncbi:MAG: hypothetical protein ABIP53_12230 [Candidatus Limnocylindrales bacterium]